jgi:hypothetical protein
MLFAAASGYLEHYASLNHWTCPLSAALPDTSGCALDKAIEFLQRINEKLKGIAKRSNRGHTPAKHPAGENRPHL